MPNVVYWLEGYYGAYTKGCYLNSGGLLDQPNFYIEGMRILDNEVNSARAAREREVADKWSSHRGR